MYAQTTNSHQTIEAMLKDALEGKLILDFSLLLPGPLATNMLAQMGARVIKIEHPKKMDETRKYPPFVEEEALMFRMLNSDKESWLIDFEEPENYKKVCAAVAKADVLIEQFRPGVMQRWGLDYNTLKAINPNLIYISLTGFGQTGPLALKAGHDINYLALTGLLDMMRDKEGCPVVPEVQIADISGGSYMLVSACLAALVKGKGQYIDLAIIDGLPSLQHIPLAQYWGGIDPHQIQLLSGGLVNYNVYACKDGAYVALGALETKFWNRFCQFIGKPDWQRQHFGELSVHVFSKEAVEAVFLTKTQQAWIDDTQQQDFCLTPVLTLAQIEHNKQLRTRGYFEEKYKIRLPWLK